MTVVKSQERRVESQMPTVALRSYSGSRLLTLSSRLSPRRGVTLLELLIVILIISILAGLILGVASVAGETARVQHTRHVVQRLHTLLTDYYGTYKNRRVRLNPALEARIDNDNSLSAAKKGQRKAEARLCAMRELMLLEIPDRWSDILLTAVPTSNAFGATPLQPIYLDTTGSGASGRTQLASIYLRRYFQVAKNAVTADQVKALTDNQGAECLYMIITIATGDGEARTLFGESTIGDTDGDGAPEFLDGWNHPISFLRWAPGFESQVQLDSNVLGVPLDTNVNWTKAASIDHDPFDLFRRDPLAFRLVPLIYSGGRDESFGTRELKNYVAWQGISNSANPPYPSPVLTPYKKASDTLDPPDDFLGTPIGDGTATDNVHNHMLGLR